MISSLVWGGRYQRVEIVFRSLVRLERLHCDPLAAIGGGVLDTSTGQEMSVADINARLSTTLTHMITVDTGCETTVELLTLTSDLRGRATVDDAFTALKLCSWELHAAAKYISGLVFDTEITHPTCETALQCYLLTHIGLVQDPHATFAGFV
jgi:hypothetical protein